MKRIILSTFNSQFSIYLSCALCLVLMTSCISNRKMIYLQGATKAYALPQDIQDVFELQVQPDDQLAISVASKDVELITRFNNNTLIGGGNNSQTGTNTINVSSGVAYFQVNKEGNIEFPIFGTVHVGGMTTGAISAMIQKRMIDEGYINDAVVNTKIMSFKVTVMGDVKNPGTQTYQGERLTILEALGKAGDLNNSAYRNNVLVVREENNVRKVYEVNLLDNQRVFNSPAYYLQQNDVIYVQPNKSQRVKGSTSYTWLTVGSTVVGMVVSIVSLVVALKK
ncbi:MAG: polysaccharide biosynthesis/export family protein [Bacteroidaceae bacterium]|nr:polysaccharide biosynthesis/export family protein [Bacteroidaceae bacterium]